MNNGLYDITKAFAVSVYHEDVLYNVIVLCDDEVVKIGGKGKVTIYADDVWAGHGRWNGRDVIDCPALIPESAYEEISNAIEQYVISSESEE